MKAIADALVYSVTYINTRPDPEEQFLEDDAGALESIAAFLSDASPEDLDALAEAAERARIAEEGLPSRRPGFVRDYANWMEEMFGEEWAGNRRA